MLTGSIPVTPRKINERGNEMPIYQFECECGHTADAFFGMIEEKIVRCEGCKTRLMKRKYTLGGTIFKGEGWGGSK